MKPDRTGKTEDLRGRALVALAAIIDDPEAPAAARAQAARTILETLGALGKHSKPPEDDAAKSLADMSRTELTAELARLRAARAVSSS